MIELARRTRIAAVIVATAAIGGGTAVVAPAYGANVASCPAQTLVQPFTKWSDSGSYFLAPSASFEGTLTGWTVSGGAKIVPGNETYLVNSARDHSSLSLPSGSSVTSPSVCVTNSTPDLRLFVLNTGSASATLNISMTYTNSKGQVATATVGTLTGTSTWSPSPLVLFLSNINSLVNSNGQTWVTFSFTPVGTTGKFQIDDFYVDPYKGH